jgi:hypothetical protein
MPAARCLPPPWTLNEHHDACFIVRDATGQALAYFYFEDGARPTIGYFDRRFSRKWEPPR